MQCIFKLIRKSSVAGYTLADSAPEALNNWKRGDFRDLTSLGKLWQLI